jgi:phage shock protein A
MTTPEVGQPRRIRPLPRSSFLVATKASAAIGKETGAPSTDLDALRKENAALRAQIEALKKEIASLTAQSNATKGPK